MLPKFSTVCKIHFNTPKHQSLDCLHSLAKLEHLDAFKVCRAEWAMPFVEKYKHIVKELQLVRVFQNYVGFKTQYMPPPITIANMPMLRRLELVELCDSLIASMMPIMKQVVQQLHTFALIGLQNSSATFANITPEWFTNTKRLTLMWPWNAQDDMARQILTVCKQLEYCKLRNCFNKSKFVYSSRHGTLKRLVLGGNYQQSDSNIICTSKFVHVRNFPNYRFGIPFAHLTMLRLAKVTISTESLIDIAKYSKLRFLSFATVIWNNICLNSDSIVAPCTSLVRLSISNCSSALSQASLDLLTQLFPSVCNLTADSQSILTIFSLPNWKFLNQALISVDFSLSVATMLPIVQIPPSCLQLTIKCTKFSNPFETAALHLLFPAHVSIAIVRERLSVLLDRYCTKYNISDSERKQAIGNEMIYLAVLEGMKRIANPTRAIKQQADLHLVPLRFYVATEMWNKAVSQ